MPEITKSYDWTIYGEIDVTVHLTLGLNCQVRGVSLMAVELAAVFCHGASYKNNGPRKFTQVKSDEPLTDKSVMCGLPEHALRAYAEMFRKEYEADSDLRDAIFDLVTDRAVASHFEMAYA